MTQSDPSLQLALVQAILAERQTMPGALLPVLHDVQDRLGYIPSAMVPVIADALNLSRAEVHGVISYYHHFRQHPAGRHVVQVCRAEACQANGGNQLAAHAQQKLGCAFHATSTDGQFTLEPVYCLGQCGCAPAIMVDDTLHARVDAARFDSVIAALTDPATSGQRRPA